MATAGAEGRAVTCRIVIFGASGAGTTATIETISRRLRNDQRGQLVRQTVATDASAGYEILPVDLGEVGGLHRRFQLATVPRGAANVGSRRQLLKGVHGIVFVADSAPDRIRENTRSMQELADHMAAYGRPPETLPIVIVLNKRDRPDAVVAENVLRPLLERLGGRRPPVFEAVATDGRGILNALSAIAKLLIAASPAVATRAPARPAAATAPVPLRAVRRPAPGGPMVRLDVESLLEEADETPRGAVSVGTPRATPGGVKVPLVLRDGRGGERRVTLTLTIALDPAAGDDA